MLPIRVSNFVSRVTILFSKSSLLSFKSEIMSYMMFWVWKTGLREIEEQRTRLNYIGPGSKLSILRIKAAWSRSVTSRVRGVNLLNTLPYKANSVSLFKARI